MTEGRIEGSTVETRWWWVRHAPVTTDNGRIYGQRDLPADCSDTAVFESLARTLPQDAVWVASNLSRTHQTAAAVHAATGHAPDISHHPELAEQHFGDWQGQDRQEVFSRYAPGHRFWLAPAEYRPPGGESFADLMTRVTAHIETLTDLHRGQDIVAVAHGGTIRAALGHALALDPHAAIAFKIDNCSVTRLDHLRLEDATVAWRVSFVNWMAG